MCTDGARASSTTRDIRADELQCRADSQQTSLVVPCAIGTVTTELPVSHQPCTGRGSFQQSWGRRCQTGPSRCALRQRACMSAAIQVNLLRTRKCMKRACMLPCSTLLLEACSPAGSPPISTSKNTCDGMQHQARMGPSIVAAEVLSRHLDVMHADLASARALLHMGKCPALRSVADSRCLALARFLKVPCPRLAHATRHVTPQSAAAHSGSALAPCE